jgi:hypothetical protein
MRAQSAIGTAIVAGVAHAVSTPFSGHRCCAAVDAALFLGLALQDTGGESCRGEKPRGIAPEPQTPQAACLP